MSIACPVCSALDKNEVERCGSYILYHCLTCDLVYADPMTSNESFYLNNKDYFLRDELIMDPSVWDFRWDIWEFLQRPPAKGGNLLDIGCGTGFFVKRAYDIGFKGYGIEFNRRSVLRGKEFFGLDTLYTLDIAELGMKFPDLRFDVVTLFQVLEHVEDPSHLLASIKRLITKTSVVVIALPLRDRWPDISGESDDRPPHHLTRWSYKAIENILEINGFFIKRFAIEKFPLKNMPRLVYKFVLKYMPSFTMIGKGVVETLTQLTREEGLALLRKRRAKMNLATAFSSPLWLILKLMGARGPNIYVEAVLKP